MARAGGIWGSLVLLGLCGCSVVRAAAPNPVISLRAETQTNPSTILKWEAPDGTDPQNFAYWIRQLREDGGSNNTQNTTAPNPVRNLRVESQTNVSISLSWEPPENSTQDLTYWAQCIRYDGQNETRDTNETKATEYGLDPGTSYQCFVWAVKDGVHSVNQNLSTTTAPNSVRNLRVEGQTNISISLSWEPPENSSTQNLTYWVMCVRYDGQNETRHTSDTKVTVDGLDPGTSYQCFVWAVQDGVPNVNQNLSTTTAPNSVRNLKVEGQTNVSISLSWEPPVNSSTQNLTYSVTCVRYDGQNETRHTSDTKVTVDGLDPGTSHQCFVWAVKDGVPSVNRNLSSTTAPNSVRNLRVKGQTNISISLSWDPPENSSTQNLTYWVTCVRYDGQNETQNTSDTNVTVDGLEPGTSYQCFVWAVKDGVPSVTESLWNTTAPNSVRNLKVKGVTDISISLSWDPPENSSTQNLTYWVTCIRYDGQNETRHTSDTKVTVDGLDPGTSYQCFVWAVKDGVPSVNASLWITTAPNSVRNLKVEGQTNVSISLSWEPPENSSTQNLTYWVTCVRYDGQNETRNTSDTKVTVDGLDPGTSYQCFVCAVKNGVCSINQNLSTTTVPAAVSITSCISTSGGYGVILTWSCPSGSYDAFEVEVGRSSQNESSCGKGVTVLGLEPAQSYKATVTTVFKDLKGQSTSATCRTESAAAIIAGVIVGILLLFILVGLLIVFLKRRKKKQPKEVSKDLVFWKNRDKKMEQRLKEGPTRDCPTWGSIMSADTKPNMFAMVKRCLLTGTQCGGS